MRAKRLDQKNTLPTSSLKPIALVAEAFSPERDMLIHKLEVDGFSIVSAADAVDVLSLIDEITPDIVILDYALQTVSGLDICRRLKETTKYLSIPVIVVSSRSEEADRILAFEAGADDYVMKPYSAMELLARVRAKLRHTRPSAVGAVIEFDTIRVDTEAHRVFISGKLVHVGPTEFRLIAALIERPGHIWTREQLLDRVWGRDINAKKSAVDIAVNRLRKAIGQDNLSYPICTVKGSGYVIG